MQIIHGFDSKSFFWINAVSYYYYGLNFLLIALGILINKNNDFLSYLFLGISAIYCGFAWEPFSLTIFTLVTSLILIKVLPNRYNYIIQLFPQKLRDISIKKIYYFLIFLVVSIALSISAPGNFIRLHKENPNVIKVNFFKTLAKNINVFVFNLVLENIVYYLVIGFVFFYFASILSKNNVGIKKSSKMFLQRFWISTSIILLIILLNILMSSFIKGELFPLRALTDVNLFISLYFAYVGYLISASFNTDGFLLDFVGKFILIILIVNQIYYNVHYISGTKVYVDAINKREKYLNQFKLNNTPNQIYFGEIDKKNYVQVDSLPNPKFNALHYMELASLSDSSGGRNNNCICRFKNVKKYIAVIKE
jgi:hypothetical protein